MNKKWHVERKEVVYAEVIGHFVVKDSNKTVISGLSRRVAYKMAKYMNKKDVDTKDYVEFEEERRNFSIYMKRMKTIRNNHKLKQTLKEFSSPISMPGYIATKMVKRGNKAIVWFEAQ